MDRIYLSICMPTYNFGKFIGATLENITSQMTGSVEIVIVDGASTDNTAEVVRGFQERFPNIIYHRLQRRGGIDQDMAKSVELARGEYCWLFSSDDLMKEKALQKVMQEIAHGFDIYLCGLTLCTLDMRPIMKHPVLSLQSDAEFNLSDPQDRLRYFELAQTTTAFFSFMGSLIFNKSKWESIPFDEAFDGSLWAHVARIFRMIPNGLRLKYLSQSYLDKRGDNDSFMDKGIVHRYKMAIEGYHRLANTFFGEESVEAFHIRRVVRNEFPAIRSLLNLKLKSTEDGNRQELVLLDSLAAKVYKDPTILNRINLLIYKFMPLHVFKAVKTLYKTSKHYLKSQHK